MAEEYRLSFTAIEIDEKLQKIDEHSRSLLELKEDIENLPQSEPIIIDSVLDSDSENPVQNKAIKAELDKKIEESSLNGLATENYVNNKFNEVEIPTSLPANGGDADTLEGKSASDFAPILHSHDSYEEKGVADIKANDALATAKQYTDTAIAELTPEKLSVYTIEEVDDMLLDLSQDILTNEDEIDTLKGEGDGSIRKSINDAINEFSTNISNDGVVNTYKELVDYAASHGAEFTELVGEVDSNKSNLTDHINNTNNPHRITPEIIGAEPKGAEENAKNYTDSALENRYTKEEVDEKVHIFHASIDNSNFQYVKGSADFTYEQVVNTENCVVEVQVANEKTYLIKQEHKNINPPDPIAGRYVGFSNVIRTAGEYAELFLFVYDAENLPTDEVSLGRLEDWGDYQYCVSSYQPIVMGNFLVTDITTNRTHNTNAPSAKAAGDYTDSQCGVVLDYMQTTFATNIMALMADAYGPHIIYDDPTGFESSDKDVGNWQLTGLDLTPYKRVKFYIKAAESGSTGSPSHIVEIHLDDRAKNAQGHFTGGHTSIFPDADSKFHNVVCSIKGDKTAVGFNRCHRYSASTSATSSGGRYCYLIEGYKN